MKRGDYDHNHQLTTFGIALIAIVVLLVGMSLGGLAVGLQILGNF